MPKLLCKTIETHDITGRGAVVVLEDPQDWRVPSSEPIRRREAIRILLPDGSSIRTFIKDIEFMRKFGGGEACLIGLPFDVPADAVPAGSMIFLEREDSTPIMWDGHRAEFSPPPSPVPLPV
jgi:hypothetical protein